MAQYLFELVPFPAERLEGENKKPLAIKISGTLEFSKQDLFISFTLSGIDYPKIVWPAQAMSPQMKDGLWQHSCFELFISPSNNTSYTEFNFSPSLNWAAYQFSDYRNITTDRIEHGIIIESNIGNAQGSLSARALMGDELVNKSIDIGVTAVIETNDGKLYYFALTHSGTKPDFHLKESFTLRHE